MMTGKEALIALANGEEVQFTMNDCISWHDSSKNLAAFKFLTDEYKFRLKPRTIKINGIEVPSPFEPKLGERYYVLQPCNESGWMGGDCADMEFDRTWSQFGAWRTKEEIKQVVAALRSIFK